jgi:siroheme synthase-like protein
MKTSNGKLKPYPIFLVGLENRHCIVVGGGKEAELKVRSLLDCDATVTVIGPTLTPALQAWAEEGRFAWLARPYQPGDLQGAFLAFAERSDPQRDALLFEEAEAEKVLVNLIDDIPHCSFIAGSVVRRGPLVITVSTSGAAPALAVRLRERFEAEFGSEYGEFLELMFSLREPISTLVPEFGERRARWYRLVDSDILDLIRRKEFAQANRRIVEIFGEEIRNFLPESSNEPCDGFPGSGPPEPPVRA